MATPKGISRNSPAFIVTVSAAWQVDPVGLALHVAQLVDVICEIFYLDLFHVKLQNKYGLYNIK